MDGTATGFTTGFTYHTAFVAFPFVLAYSFRGTFPFRVYTTPGLCRSSRPFYTHKLSLFTPLVPPRGGYPYAAFSSRVFYGLLLFRSVYFAFALFRAPAMIFPFHFRLLRVYWLNVWFRRSAVLARCVCVYRLVCGFDAHPACTTPRFVTPYFWFTRCCLPVRLPRCTAPFTAIHYTPLLR